MARLIYSKNSGKNKYVYSHYRLAFDGADSWSFGNNFAKNVVTFGVDNSSSSHTDNCENNFLVLGQRPADDDQAKFCLRLNYNGDNS